MVEQDFVNFLGRMIEYFLYNRVRDKLLCVVFDYERELPKLESRFLIISTFYIK